MAQNKANRRFARLVGVAITLIIILAYLSPMAVVRNLFTRLDYLFYDMRFNLAPLSVYPQVNQIVIVDIDEKSLAEQGRWPWSRGKLALLNDRLVESGALVVGYDIIFSELEKNPIDELINLLREKGLPQGGGEQEQYVDQIERHRHHFDNDQRFAAAIAKGEVVLGYFFHADSEVSAGELPPAIPFNPGNSNLSLVVHDMASYTANLPLFSRAALSQGFFSLIPDFDGKVRRAPLILQYKKQLYTSLALEVAKVLLFVDEIEISTARLGDVMVVEEIILDQIKIPVDEFGQALVPYNQAQGKLGGYFKYISATDILNDKFDSGIIDSSLVLVGTSASGLEDIKTTPLITALPGVEVHAAILDAILKYQQFGNQFPFRPAFEQGVTPTVLLLLGLLLTWWLAKLKPLFLFLVCACTVVLVVASNFYIWQSYRFDLPLAPFLLLTLFLTLFSLGEGYLRESNRRESLKEMFGQYVPKAHIERMLEGKEAYSFDGESKQLTVMFCDIRSFTTLSEGLSAAELKKMLNRFFTPITQIIFNNEGTIDKYVGDMVMAFWGAPVDDRDHANHAVKAALAMLDKVEELKVEFKTLGLPEINIGIGLNSGLMNVGDMGSNYRKAYTVLGDAVNLGSRLEGITKFYGVKLLVGEDTKKLADQFEYRTIDKIKVKGKTKAIVAYEPVGKKGELPRELKENLQCFNKGLQAYYAKDWLAAKNYFKDLLARDNSHTKLYQQYLHRIQQLQDTTLPEDWDGVYEHLTK